MKNPTPTHPTDPPLGRGGLCPWFKVFFVGQRPPTHKNNKRKTKNPVKYCPARRKPGKNLEICQNASKDENDKT